MTSLACAFLRHDVRPRWIGDLLAAFCHDCGCIYIPERTSQQGGERRGLPPASSFAPLPSGAVARPAA